MPSTQSTLFDAFKRAGQLGINSTPLGQVLGGFKGITGRDKAGGNSIQSQLGMALEPYANRLAGASADMFRSATPQWFRDDAGGALQNMFDTRKLFQDTAQSAVDVYDAFSGHDKRQHVVGDVDTSLRSMGRGGGYISDALGLMSPVNIATAGVGPELSAGLASKGMLGRAAGGLVSPVLSHPNFGVRLGGEMGVQLGGQKLDEFLVPEDAPLALHMLAQAGGGVLSAATIGRMLRPTTMAIERSLDDMAQPGAVNMRNRFDDLNAEMATAPNFRSTSFGQANQALRTAEEGKPLSLFGFREEGTNPTPGTGVFYAADPDLALQYKRGPLAGDPSRPEVRQSLSVHQLDFDRPLIADEYKEGLLEKWVADPQTPPEQVVRMNDLLAKRDTLDFHAAADKVIADEAKLRGYDGIVYRDQTGSATDLSEVVDLRPRHPAVDLDATSRVRLAQIAALDEAAPPVRSAVLEAGDGAVPPRALPVNDELMQTVDDYWSMAKSSKGDMATRTVSMMDIGTRNLPTAAKSSILPKWLAKAIDGNVGRTPVMQRIASTAHAYMSSEANLAGNVSTLLRHDMDNLFGKGFEKASLTVDAPPELRRAFDLMQRSQNHLGMGNLLVEEREFFNLTDAQKGLLDNYDRYLEHDVGLLNAFGVDLKEVDGPYARHVIEMLDVDGKVLDAQSFAFLSARQLGKPLSFQKPRTFDKTLDLINASLDDDASWRARILKAQDASKGNADEVQRLQNILDLGIRLRLSNANFQDAFAQRLAEGGRARGEALAISTAKPYGPAVESDVRRILETQKISDTVQAAAKAAATLRSVVLNLDASTMGVQSWGAVVMGKGLKNTLKSIDGDMLRNVTDDAAFARWTVTNADRLSRAQLAGVEINSNVLEMTRGYTRDDLLEYNWRLKGKEVMENGAPVQMAGQPLRQRGAGVPVVSQVGATIRALNDVQFRRLVTMWKLDAFEHTDDLVRMAGSEKGGRLKALMQGHPLLGGISADPIKRSEEVGSFVNNLFGGLNRVQKGRSVNQNLIESIFALTPGFTRGTLAMGINTLKPGLEGALARDFAIRGTLLAGSIVTGMTMAVNGIVDGKLVLPNLTDPDREDWFDIPLPGGHSIRPMARWRGPAKIAFESLETAVTKNPLDAITLFTKDSVRWASYRQSALVGTVLGDPLGDVLGPEYGNSFAKGKSIKDILFDPSTNRLKDVMETLTSITPVPVQNVVEAVQLNGASPKALWDMAFSVGVQFFGVSEFGPSLTERSVSEAGARLALAAGMDEGLVAQTLQSNRPAWNAKDAAGTYVLPSNVRKQMAEQVAQETGLDIKLVQQGGRQSQRERDAQYEAVQDAQIGTFVQGVKDVDAEYRKKVLALEEGLNRGLIGPDQYSANLTKLRLQRAGGKAALEGAAPAAILFLGSDKHKESQNAQDALFSSISAEMFSQEFYDPYTGSFDFDAQNQLEARTRAKYGAAYDDWQKIRDDKKTPMELDRDRAFETLSPYFAMADEMWMQATGGALGPNERAFDQAALKEISQNGVTDPGMARMVLTQLKSAIPPVQTAHQVTTFGRQIMRLQDSDVDRAATVWLGAQPVQL